MQSTLRMNWLQIASGAAFLLCGVLVYSLARSALIWGLPLALHVPATISWLGRMSGSAPTFAHTAALSLLTAGVLGGTRRGAWSACVAWMLVNIAFEFGQHPLVRLHLVGSLPHWLERVWLLDRTRCYFMNGTFDYTDIVAAVLGGATAFAIISMTREHGVRQ
jgi:hypothetical protein